MKFGKRIKDESKPEWRDFYINYSLLKHKVSDVMACRDLPNCSQAVVIAKKTIFQGCLDDELVKMMDFFKKQSEQLLQHIEQTRQTVESCLKGSIHVTESTVKDLIAAVVQHAQAITDLLHYVGLNMVAVRKILKKFTKQVPDGLEGTDGIWILEVMVHPDAGHTIQQPTFLPPSAALDLQNMIEHKEIKAAANDLQSWHKKLCDLLRSLRSSQARLPLLSEASPSLLPNATPGRDVHVFFEKLRSSESAADLEASFVRPIPPWSANMAAVFEEAPKPAFEEVLAERKWQILVGLTLNLLNSLLYMANYNVVVPTVNSFCEHLGVSISLSGVIIGLADVAAIIFSFVYSYWSNASFRTPIIFSGVACFFGNFFYCLSYNVGGLLFLLIGRFLTGMGNARMINRRYIADYIPNKYRTLACTAFVTSSALGMAIGPLLSVPLHNFPESEHSGMTFSPLTMPGWVMAGVWLLLLLASVIFFREPPIELAREARDRVLRPNSNSSKSTTDVRKSGKHTPRLSITPAQSVGDLQQPLLLDSHLDLEEKGEQTPAVGLEKEKETKCAGLASLQLPSSNSLHTLGAASRSSSTTSLPALSSTVAVVRGIVNTGPLTSPLPVEASALDSPTHEPPAPPSLRSTVPTTLACVAFLFVLKLVQQAFVDGVPIFTSTIGWDAGDSGLFLAVCGFAMLPITFGVGLVARCVQDRVLAFLSCALTIAGCVFLFRGISTTWTYFLGGASIYVGTAVLEGAAMSLTSKVIHPRLAQGTFNAGLLTTEAGSIGRLMGNLFLSAVGQATGLKGGDAAKQVADALSTFALVLHSLCAGFMSASLAYFLVMYRKLSVRKD